MLSWLQIIPIPVGLYKFTIYLFWLYLKIEIIIAVFEDDTLDYVQRRVSNVCDSEIQQCLEWNFNIKGIVFLISLLLAL